MEFRSPCASFAAFFFSLFCCSNMEPQAKKSQKHVKKQQKRSFMFKTIELSLKNRGGGIWRPKKFQKHVKKQRKRGFVFKTIALSLKNCFGGILVAQNGVQRVPPLCPTQKWSQMVRFGPFLVLFLVVVKTPKICQFWPPGSL